MRQRKLSKTLGEVSNILGEDFLEGLTDVLPLIGPKVDMYRGEQELIITVELPGLQSQNDVVVSLHGYTIVIRGEIVRPYAVNDDQFIIEERASGHFKRKLRLPKNCILDRLQADYWNGLLIIRVPFSDHQDDDDGERVNIQFHS